MLLQFLQRIEIVLGRGLCALRLDDLRVERDELFLRASSLEFRLIGLRGSHLGLRLSCLGANVVVVQLQQQLAFAYVVAFLHQQAFHRGGNGSVRFEVLERLNLAVG